MSRTWCRSMRPRSVRYSGCCEVLKGAFGRRSVEDHRCNCATGKYRRGADAADPRCGCGKTPSVAEGTSFDRPCVASGWPFFQIATGCRVLRFDRETRMAQEGWFVRVRPERKCPPSFESGPNLKNYQRTLSSLYRLNFSSQVTTGTFSHTAWAMIWRLNGSAWCRGRSKR
jgi:hypothetical protein